MTDIKTISMNQVNPSEERYRFHYDKFDHRPLFESIKNHGILTPLHLEKHHHKFCIVNGFRRFESATKLGIREIPVIIEEKDPLEQLKTSLLDNRVQSAFNLYEQAKALECARTLGASESTIIQEFLPLVGLHAHKNVYDEYRGFLRLPQPLIDFFTEKDIAISRTLTFQSLSPEGQQIAVELLETFSPGINVLDELLTNLYEISRRTDQTVPQLYAELRINEILEESGQPHVALGKIRQHLREHRYPVLHKTNQQINKLVDTLELGENVKIKWDHRLENQGITISCHWTSLKEIEETIQFFTKSSNLKLFKEIFEKI